MRFMRKNLRNHPVLLALLFVFSITLAFHYLNTTDQDILQQEIQRLDHAAIAAGSDKSSKNHNYTRIYPIYFTPYKNKAIKFLEIGIFKGNSVKMWEKYFSEAAELHFMDITADHIKYNSSRSKYHFHDQANIDEMQAFANEFGPFDIVIDDGGHVMQQQINTFKAMIKFVKPGGIYVIEDTHTSYWSAYGGHGQFLNRPNKIKPKPGPGTAINLLKDLIDDVNYEGAYGAHGVGVEANNKEISKINYYTRHIETLHFYDSMCVILLKK